MADVEDIIAELERMENDGTAEEGAPEEEPEIPDDIDKLILTVDDAVQLFNAPKPPASIDEALEQRLAKFEQTLQESKASGNAGKTRRMERIVKSYKTALRNYKAGKPVDLQDLPTPPGFAPIPLQDFSPKPARPTSERRTVRPPAPVPAPVPPVTLPPVVDPLADAIQSISSRATKLPDPIMPTKVEGGKRPAPQPPASNPEHTSDEQSKNAAQPPAPRPPLRREKSTVTSKQLNYLVERQELFRQAALESKQKGDIQQAKEYLRKAKGFDPLIDATRNGLPIDATSIPTPPQLEDDFVMVSRDEPQMPDFSDSTSANRDLEEESHPSTTLPQPDDERIFQQIVEHLDSQIKMCKQNKDHFMKLGDISTGSKFEKYALDSRKDLDSVLVRWRNVHQVPLFRYETRTFSIVICNTDVSVNELIIEIIAAHDIPAKPDIDTYVKWEFCFPTDAHQSGRTYTVKNSCDPQFSETFRLAIDRKSRGMLRVLKRNALKLELWSKGGFFRNDTLLGTAQVRLSELENKCTLRDTFQLFEGRKATGARLEVSVKIREPFLSKQVEEVKQKWLILE